jgi:uncharacterized protein (TIGR02001 family)
VIASRVRWCAAAATVLFALATAARAQTGAGVTLVSDERFRGVSLSNSRPAARASLNYDHPSGWYVGGAAADVELDSERRQLALLTYLGYAQRTASGLGWELGATAANFAVDSRYNYGEAFAGLIAQRWNARVYTSPSYFGSGHSTVYAEINGGLPLNQPLGRPLTLFGHVGALASGHGSPDADQKRAHADASAGLSAGFDGLELRLTWVVGGHEALYPIPHGQRTSVLVLGAAYFF